MFFQSYRYNQIIMDFEFVTVTDGITSLQFRVKNNTFNFKSVKSHFDLATGLTYDYLGKNTSVEIENDKAEVVPGISLYTISRAKSNCTFLFIYY